MDTWQFAKPWMSAWFSILEKLRLMSKLEGKIAQALQKEECLLLGSGNPCCFPVPGPCCLSLYDILFETHSNGPPLFLASVTNYLSKEIFLKKKKKKKKKTRQRDVMCWTSSWWLLAFDFTIPSHLQGLLISAVIAKILQINALSVWFWSLSGSLPTPWITKLGIRSILERSKQKMKQDSKCSANF